MIIRYKENEIDKLVEILKHDGVISVPTDTVYGLCARIATKKAYDKLAKVKNRAKEKAFAIMCANEQQIKDVAIVDERTEKIIQAFMPGPITLVLPKKNSLPGYVTNNKDTVAVRMATSKKLEELIMKTESPLFMTSANKSGKPECVSLDDIEKACPLLDGMLEGNTTFGEASTIIDCSFKEVKILRTGPIKIDQILEIIKVK